MQKNEMGHVIGKQGRFVKPLISEYRVHVSVNETFVEISGFIESDVERVTAIISKKLSELRNRSTTQKQGKTTKKIEVSDETIRRNLIERYQYVVDNVATDVTDGDALFDDGKTLSFIPL